MSSPPRHGRLARLSYLVAVVDAAPEDAPVEALRTVIVARLSQPDIAARRKPRFRPVAADLSTAAPRRAAAHPAPLATAQTQQMSPALAAAQAAARIRLENRALVRQTFMKQAPSAPLPADHARIIEELSNLKFV